MKRKWLLVFVGIFIMTGCYDEWRNPPAQLPTEEIETSGVTLDDIPLNHELIEKAEYVAEAIEAGELEPYGMPDQFIIHEIRSRLRPHIWDINKFMMDNQELFPGYCSSEAGWHCSEGDRDWFENEYIRMIEDLIRRLIAPTG